ADLLERARGQLRAGVRHASNYDRRVRRGELPVARIDALRTEGQEVVASELKPALTRLLLEDRLHESLRRIGVRRTLENDKVSGTEMLRNRSRGRLDVGCVRIFRSGHGRRYADEKDVDVVGLREVVVCDKRFGLDDIAKFIVIDVVDQILPGV